MQLRKKIRLGDLLVENKMISSKQLEAALGDHKRSGRKLGRVLIDNGYIDEPALLEFLSRQLNIDYIDLKTHPFEAGVVNIVPEIQARRYRAIALAQTENDVLLGMADPTDIFAYDELARIIKRPVKIAVVSEADLLAAFDRLYRRTEEISAFAEQLQEELVQSDQDLGELASSQEVSDAPAVRLIDSLFKDAVQIGASDIHIEPDDGLLRLRQRVDGMLQEQVMDEHRIAPALVVRLKLMSGLDISEKRMPQDGRMSIKVSGRKLDVRVSTMPVQHGESVVLRLLDQDAGLKSLDALGMSQVTESRFRRCIAAQNGVVLVSGPTGSGKTTTLYSALSLLNRAESKIITVEDPVEYRLPRINQVQVNADIGLTYAKVLRAILRQDPDTVLIGEMRDEETVEIGLRAAVTGHLVLSTIHTNDAPSTIIRLLDMGAQGYLIGSAVRAVMAQRLIRENCPECTRPAGLEPYAAAWLARQLGDRVGAGTIPVGEQRGEGCTHCHHTGYRGRIGVYELFELDVATRAAIGAEDVREFGLLAEKAQRGATLADHAIEHMLAGRSTVAEAMRISGAAVEVLPEASSSPAPVAADSSIALSAG